MIPDKTMTNLFPDGCSGIIFDCDGVMIDSADANRYLYNTILESLGLPRLTPEQERFAFQATFIQALHSLVPKKFHDILEEKIPALIKYDRDILPKIKLMHGYRAFVEEAATRGLRMAIDTNRTDPGIHKVIEYFCLPNCFKPVISCSVAAAPKPSPAGALAIMDDWSVPPAQILFAGDSEDDKKAAKGAGMIFAAFNNPDLRGDLNISSWDQMATILWQDK